MFCCGRIARGTFSFLPASKLRLPTVGSLLFAKLDVDPCNRTLSSSKRISTLGTFGTVAWSAADYPRYVVRYH